MVKNTKKGSVSHGKPITDFFKRAPKTPSATPPSQPSSSPPKGPSAKAITKDKTEAAGSAGPSKLESKLPSSASSTEPVGVEDMPATSSQPLSERDGHSEAYLTPPNSSPGSRKRTRSPSPEPMKVGSSSGTNASPEKSASTVKKRARLSSPAAEIEQTIVPSSQSDEEDMSMESIPRFKLRSEPSSDHAMSTDKSDGPAPRTSPSLPPSPLLSEDQSSPTANRQTSQPPMPVAVTQASKAAQMIADMKKRAYAKVSVSPEPESPPLYAGMESSSDDDEDLFPLKIQPKAVKPAAAPAAKPTRQSARLSAKDRSTSPAPRASTSRLPPPKPKKHVPFESLLREQRLATKRGVDDAALKRAEETAKQITEEAAAGAEDEEFDDSDDEDNVGSWDADIQGQVQDPKAFIEKLGLSRDVKDEETRKTLFGAPKEKAKGAFDILNDDFEVRQHDKSVVKNPGVPFWLPVEGADDMAVDEDVPYPPTTASPILSMLNVYLRRQDHARAATILSSSIMQTISPSEQEATATYLYDLVFSSRQLAASLRQAAFNALHHFIGASDSYSLPFTRILETVCSLGANPEVLSSGGWELPTISSKVSDNQTRNVALGRLLALLTPSSVRPEDVPDVTVLLLLIAMDSKSTPERLLEIAQIVNRLGQCVSSDRALQFSLCSKVVKVGTPYDAVNKDRLISLLSSGSGPVRRVASFAAYAFVTDQDTLRADAYTDTPPLSDLLGQLTTRSKFTVDKDTDYVDLGFYINMLAVAVYDVRSYVTQENESVGGSRGDKDRDDTELQMFRMALDTMHGKIADTRATHLERSRTKAVIKGLVMTVYYLRKFWLKRDGEPQKPKTLAGYFSRK